MNLATLMNLSLDSISLRLHIWLLKHERKAALRNIDVANAKAANELALVSLYQKQEAEARRELYAMGVKVD